MTSSCGSFYGVITHLLESDFNHLTINSINCTECTAVGGLYGSMTFVSTLILNKILLLNGQIFYL